MPIFKVLADEEKATAEPIVVVKELGWSRKGSPRATEGAVGPQKRGWPPVVSKLWRGKAPGGNKPSVFSLAAFGPATPATYQTPGAQELSPLCAQSSP